MSAKKSLGIENPITFLLELIPTGLNQINYERFILIENLWKLIDENNISFSYGFMFGWLCVYTKNL